MNNIDIVATEIVDTRELINTVSKNNCLYPWQRQALETINSNPTTLTIAPRQSGKTFIINEYIRNTIKHSKTPQEIYVVYPKQAMAHTAYENLRSINAIAMPEAVQYSCHTSHGAEYQNHDNVTINVKLCSIAEFERVSKQTRGMSYDRQFHVLADELNPTIKNEYVLEEELATRNPNIHWIGSFRKELIGELAFDWRFKQKYTTQVFNGRDHYSSDWLAEMISYLPKDSALDEFVLSESDYYDIHPDLDHFDVDTYVDIRECWRALLTGSHPMEAIENSTNDHVIDMKHAHIVFSGCGPESIHLTIKSSMNGKMPVSITPKGIIPI